MGKLRCETLRSGGYVVLLATLVFPVGCAKATGVLVELGRNFGEFSVVNRGSTISLNSAVTVEQKVNGKWVRASVTNLYLRETCGAQPQPCRRLEHNDRITAVQWTGKFCSSQCPVPCRLDGPAPPGTYRFVVTSCDGKDTFASPEFKKTD